MNKRQLKRHMKKVANKWGCRLGSTDQFLQMENCENSMFVTSSTLLETAPRNIQELLEKNAHGYWNLIDYDYPGDPAELIDSGKTLPAEKLGEWRFYVFCKKLELETLWKALQSGYDSVKRYCKGNAQAYHYEFNNKRIDVEKLSNSTESEIESFFKERRNDSLLLTICKRADKLDNSEYLRELAECVENNGQLEPVLEKYNDVNGFYGRWNSTFAEFAEMFCEAENWNGKEYKYVIEIVKKLTNSLELSIS